MKSEIHLTSPMSSGSIAGLCARAAAFLLVMLLALGAGIGFALAGGDWSVEMPSVKIVIVMFLIVAVPMLAGMFLFELPRGSDWLLFRLGVATFCRTGLPLLIVLSVSVFAKANLASAAYGFLAYFYLIGFLASVWISVNRFASCHVPVVDSVVEVDRAAD